MAGGKKSYQDVAKQLKDVFGYDYFKGDQEAVIRSFLSGKNAVVIMPTGAGKSMCYQLPALMMNGTAVIISPLIALMKNQVDAIRNHFIDKSIAHVLNSTLSRPEQHQVKEEIVAGKTKLLYVAPEFLLREDNIRMLRKVKVSFFAIDEAHCISEWGHDFRPEYRKIRQRIEKIGQKFPIMALTATATPKVRYDIQKNLGIENAEVFLSSFDRPNIYYEVREKNENIDKNIVRFIKKHSGKSGIIYCRNRRKVEDLAVFLQANDIKALPYHAGMPLDIRSKNQDDFINEDADVIVATIAFGMGIDKPDVRFVIHYDIPKSLESYYQETGRVGRDDGEAICIAFYSHIDITRYEKIIKKKPILKQDIERQLLAETAAYAESNLCRRKNLLFYFGETYKKANCGSCDNCLKEKKMEEGREYMYMLLETVKDTQQQFKEKHIVNILVGNLSADIKQFGHDELNHFGEGYEKSEQFWLSLIRQALFEKLLVYDRENVGFLEISEIGERFLTRPYSIPIVKEKNKEDDDDLDTSEAIASQKGGSVDKVLFNMLKDLLKTIAKHENLPPYVVFQETSLEDMCIQYPITLEEMTQISGVGIGKAQKYGQPFIELISKYVEDNEIDRPQDIVVKSIVNKSGLKVFIIQNIDEKMHLEDLAVSKNLTMDELLSVIESIVASGTKINIDYYIDGNVDKYHQEEILEYLQETQEDSLETALQELGEDEYTEEEIRLMRIKFLSDRGN